MHLARLQQPYARGRGTMLTSLSGHGSEESTPAFCLTLLLRMCSFAGGVLFMGCLLLGLCHVITGGRT